MYYLNDIRAAVDGMTHLIPRFHRFGRLYNGEESSSLWHRDATVQL